MSEPIAIVGMATLFPKAENLSDYWNNLCTLRDCISDVPEDYSWSPSDYYDANKSAPDKTWATRGGYLDKVPFDPMEWGIPPNVLEAIDTTQLLALLVTRDALIDAGLDPNDPSWDRRRAGVILGVTGTQEMAVTSASRLRAPQWKSALRRHGLDEATVDSIAVDIAQHFPEWTEQTFPGLLGNVVAGRICNRFNLGGTNCTIDAACASSLAAYDFATSQLLSGKADIMIAGGADTLNDIFMHMCFSKTPALSHSNDSHPFDASADGILLGEGIGLTVLKRLSDAEAAGDRIYAVIRGIGSSSDGRSKSIYAPSETGQQSALTHAYQLADVHPSTIELIEAHGTGTKVGDLTEVNALRDLLKQHGLKTHSVALGTVKSQIGHTKSAAGAAGLIKAALALHHKVLPGTLKVTTPHPKMRFDDSPLYVNTVTRPWIRAADHPRRAGVSAFGFGGSNFHAILEEYPGDPPGFIAPSSQLFLFGADSPEALKEQLNALAPHPSLAGMARLICTRWTPSAHVLGFVARDLADYNRKRDIAQRLLASGPGSNKHVFYGHVQSAPRVGLLFPGQGSQSINMGAALALRYPIVRRALDEADEAFRAVGREPLSGVLFPPPAFSVDATKAQQATLTQTEWAQPALGAVSRGFFDLLSACGVRPHAVAGHSYGELVALYAAGVFEAKALMTASRVRGESMAAGATDRGAMAAVSGPLQRIGEVLNTLKGDVVLANLNHPKQGVISGSLANIAVAIDAIEAAGLSAKTLNVSAAFHSSLVADARRPFLSCLESLTVKAPSCPVISNLKAAPYPSENTAIRTTLADQITSPVLFSQSLHALEQEGCELLVECGPKTVLSGLAHKTLGASWEHRILSLDDGRATDGDEAFKLTLVQLAVHGVPVNLGPLLSSRLPLARKTTGSPATVWIGGANLRRKRALPAPLHPLPHTPNDTPPHRDEPSQAHTRPLPLVQPPTPPLNTLPSDQHPPIAQPPIEEHTMDASTLALLLDATRRSLDAFQESQERTASVHETYLKTHQIATESFRELFHTQAQLISQLSGGASLPAPAPRHAAPIQRPTPAHTAPTQPLSPTPRTTPTVTLSGPPTTSTSNGAQTGLTLGATMKRDSVTLPPMLTAASMSQERASKTQFGPAKVTSSASSPNLLEAMYTAVAEKTGYPVDMLEPEMELEADLGIDSIKRVEILAHVQDAVPQLPELDNDALSSLQSLQAVVDYLNGLLGTSVSSERSNSSAPDLLGAMYTAVAEKTGYPVDMLKPEMKLEADLGIDSIKRVEILAHVQDAVPQLPELDNDALSSLQSLQAVVDYLNGLLGAAPGEKKKSAHPHDASPSSSSSSRVAL